ncbi:MAG: substrate-binding domain-containing protein [Acidobacteriaceae bacterium]|nr:substrate-binding domain-containing protein [Acidobacteriaceae bacterium]MBV9443288.1 substrate-binding domain-containing protein [Acidobacteriaceae bacterium]
MNTLVIGVAALMAIALPCSAQSTETIRIWGNDQMATLLGYWEAAFRQTRPDVRFEDKLFGPASAMAGIYTEVADLSVMGHELQTDESMGFEWVHQYKALGIEVATAGLQKHSNGAALVIFVHRDNPIRQLSLAQLDAIFGSEHKRATQNIRTWGDLGLAGDWKDRPIHAYGYASGTEGGAFFRRRVLENSYKWNCDLKEFDNAQGDDGKLVDAGPRIVAALEADRFGIAFSKMMYANASVKAVALREFDSGPYFEPTPENVATRAYPLTRTVMVYLNRQPDKPIRPRLQQFLEYVLSREGQRQATRDGGYFPLSADIADAQLEKLK